MTLGRRAFVGGLAAAGLAGCTAPRGRAVPAEAAFLQPGFEGFAAALAYARTRAGDGCRVELHVREDRLLAGWADDDRFRIVRTGGPKDGVWHLDTRGLCLEFMLRMEVMGPVASTPHPRPGQVWEPVLRVGDARRLMARMLAESGVALVTGCTRAQPFAPADRTVSGADFIAGQRIGTAAALANRRGIPVEDLDPSILSARLARDFALPG